MSNEISFKSVGIKADDPRLRQPVETRPVGIKTPLQLGTGRSGLFRMSFDPISQADDNLRNLILTNNGERLGRYGYGANLRELTTELTAKEDFDNEAVLRIRSAVAQSMPYVELDTFMSSIVDRALKESSGAEPGVGKVTIKVTYNIPTLRVSGRAVHVDIYCIG